MQTESSSYVLEALGWHITAGHSDWLTSGEVLAERPDVQSAYRQVDDALRPNARYRIIGLMHEENGHTEYSPVEGGVGVRLLVSATGLQVEVFEVCVAEEVEFGLVEFCDCGRC